MSTMIRRIAVGVAALGLALPALAGTTSASAATGSQPTAAKHVRHQKAHRKVAQAATKEEKKVEQKTEPKAAAKPAEKPAEKPAQKPAEKAPSR
jgi:outer membrane biosynthesis protein TonB